MKKEIKDEEVKKEVEEQQEEVKEEIEGKEEKNKNEAALYKQQFEELEDKYKRIFAEFDNFKKRTEKESFKTYENAKINILLGILPILDSFDQAKNNESTDENYKSGIELIFKQFEDYLRTLGVSEIITKDAKFDPELHDAVNIVEDSGLESGMIVETFRKGYKLGTQVLRHSMVTVQK